MKRLAPILLVAIAACRATPPPKLEPLADAPARPAVLALTESELDDSATQIGGPAWRMMTWEARGEGAQVVSLALRILCDRPRIDETGTAVFCVDVRSDAPDAPPRVLGVHDSGRPIALRSAMRARLAEGDAETPEAAKVTSWSAVPLGAEEAGLDLRIEPRGEGLVWRLRCADSVGLLLDADPVAALDRGLLSLHVVGPDGHLLPPRPREGRLVVPSVRRLGPGEEATGEVDLAALRDLPDGEVRVVLVYSSYASPERIASYVEGVRWPKGWTGALASNELVFRVTRE